MLAVLSGEFASLLARNETKLFSVEVKHEDQFYRMNHAPDSLTALIRGLQNRYPEATALTLVAHYPMPRDEQDSQAWADLFSTITSDVQVHVS